MIGAWPRLLRITAGEEPGDDRGVMLNLLGPFTYQTWTN